jgi:hypothetical protein
VRQRAKGEEGDRDQADLEQPLRRSQGEEVEQLDPLGPDHAEQHPHVEHVGVDLAGGIDERHPKIAGFEMQAIHEQDRRPQGLAGSLEPFVSRLEREAKLGIGGIVGKASQRVRTSAAGELNPGDLAAAVEVRP